MGEHYLTQQHQEAILQGIHQRRSQLLDSQMDTAPSRTTAATNDPATTRLHKPYKTNNILPGGTETSNDDGQYLNNGPFQSETGVPLSVEESQSFLQGVKHNQDILNQDVISLKEKIDDMRYVSYDGTLVWKITNFREKMGKLTNRPRNWAIFYGPARSGPSISQARPA
jgi:hypothetical protein